MAVVIDHDKCCLCGSCVDVCQSNTLSQTGDLVVILTGSCTECGACVGECPNNALYLPQGLGQISGEKAVTHAGTESLAGGYHAA